jgi:pyrroloquinoline quinone (PQQ) biosynthesis protein C
MATSTASFIEELNREVYAHPAVNHPFLERVASKPFSKEAWLAFGHQLYPHVHFFIPYMEELLLNTFDVGAKLIVAKILLDEYGEDAAGDSHPELFRRFIRAAGGEEADQAALTTPLDPASIDMVQSHMRLCRDEPFLHGLGAIGPAHELAITKMFPPLVEGLRSSGFNAKESEFFSLHVDHDEEHAAMLDEAVAMLARTEETQKQVRDGTLASLEKRYALWSAMERRMTAIDEGAPPPPTAATLVEITRDYKHVPDAFWPVSAAT